MSALPQRTRTIRRNRRKRAHYFMSLSAVEPSAVLARRQHFVLAAFALLYTVLYAAFWPRAATTMDEASYLGFAYVLRQGTLFPDAAHATVLLAFPVGDHLVSKYPLGMSALLALVSWGGGWPFTLGTNLLVHLATFGVTVKLLRARALSPLWALLFLFHPTAVLYSRTVLSDPASGLLIALGLLCLQKNKWLWAGFWAGIALTFRTGNVIALPVFAGAAFLQASDTPLGQRIRAALEVAAGSLPGVLLAAYYMLIVTQNQMGRNTGSFGLSYFPIMFGGYVLMLMVLYPGLLLAPAFALWRKRDGFALASAGLCYGTFVLYSFWFYRDQGGSALETLIVGQRYFLAVLSSFIVAYAAVLQPLFTPLARRYLTRAKPARQERFKAELILAAGALCGIVGAGINARHNKLLKPMAQVRDSVLLATAPRDLIFCNTQVGKLLPPGWGNRTVVVPSGDLQKDVQIVSGQLKSGRAGRVFIAYWVRPGRDDDAQEAVRVRDLIKALGPNYALQTLSERPDGVTMVRVTAKNSR